MKYSELHRALKKIGCIDLKRQISGHPAWYSPITGITFTTSNHLNAEVKSGTLRAIKRQSGLK